MSIESEWALPRRTAPSPNLPAKQCIAVLTAALVALTVTVGCAANPSQLAAPDNPVTTLPIPPGIPSVPLPSDIPPVPLPSDVPKVQMPSDIPRVQLPADIPPVQLPADIPAIHFP